MDLTVFTGQMPLAELKQDKRREYERLLASGQLEDHLAQPHPEIVLKTITVFASIALAAGFGIVLWIIYAMVLAYK